MSTRSYDAKNGGVVEAPCPSVAQFEIAPTTKVSDILDRFGDIADVMQVFGVRPVGRYDIRRVLAKALTVERAAMIHRVPPDEFIGLLRQAIAAVGEHAVATSNGGA